MTGRGGVHVPTTPMCKFCRENVRFDPPMTAASAICNHRGAGLHFFAVNVGDQVICSLTRRSFQFTDLSFSFSDPIGRSWRVSNACCDTNSTDTTAVVKLCKMDPSILKGIFTWIFCL